LPWTSAYAMTLNFSLAVNAWVNDRRQKGLSISSTELHLKALNVSKTIQNTKDFKASIDWCYGFMRRHDLSFRRCTHISQKTR
jgi:hypothetical protein